MKQLKPLLNKIQNMSVPVKASIAFMVCSFLQRGISTLTTPIFTRLLTEEQYGYYSVFNAWLEIVSVFTTLKLSGSVFMQALVKFDDDKDKLTSSVAGLGTMISLFTFATYWIFRNWLNKWMGISTFMMVCIFLASWATMIFELWAGQERNQYRYVPLVIMTIFTSLAKPLSGIVAVLMTDVYKAEARILSTVVVEIVAYSWLFFIFLKKGKSFYDKKYWTYSFSLNAPLIPHYLTRMVLNQSDRLMIKAMIGFGAAGIYSLAHNLAWMLTLITNAIMNTLNPWIFQRIKKKNYNHIPPTIYAVLVLVASVGIGMVSLAPEIIRIFAPEGYYGAVWIIPPLCVSVYFMFLFNLFAAFEYYFEKTSFLTIASTIGGVLNIILNFIFIRLLGYIAAGYTTLVCYIFYAVAHYICYRKILNENLEGIQIYDIRIIIGISGGFLLVCAALLFLYDKIVLRYALIAVILLIMFSQRMKLQQIYKQLKTK